MKKTLFVALALICAYLPTWAQFVNHVTLPQWNDLLRVQKLFWLNTTDTSGYSAATYPGAIIFRQQPGDTSHYSSNGVRWVKIGSGATDLSHYWDSTAVKGNFPIDTLQDIPALQAYTGKAKVLLVKDPLRGGLFYVTSTGTEDNILTFIDGNGRYLARSFNPADGIKIDWSGADPTGATDASPAIKSTLSLPYKKFVFNPAGRYRLDDSIRVANKDSMIVDFNGATIYENTVHDRTIVFYGCNALTVKNAAFDGAQTYASWQASGPQVFRSYLQLDSCTHAVVQNIRSKNKQGAVGFRKAYKFLCDNISHTGFLDPSHTSSGSFCTAVYVAHDGFDAVASWDGYSVISNVYAENNGSAVLLGDDAQLYTLYNIRGSNLFDNGIYISSGLYVTVKGCLFRYVSGTGIKARGRGFSLTGNVITNSGVGIAVTGNGSDTFFGPIPDELGGNGYGTIVSNNTIDTVSLKGISVEAQDSNTPHDITVADNIIAHHTNAANYALQVTSIGYTHVIGNKIYGSAGPSACYMNNKAGDSTQYNVFANNIFHNCTGKGITFDGVKNSTIEGNVFSNVTGDAMYFSNCRANNVVNNTADGNTFVVNASSTAGNVDNFFSLNKGGKFTTTVASNIALYNLPNLQQGIAARPRLAAQTTISSAVPYIAKDTTSASDWTRLSTFYSLNGLTGATQTFTTGTTGTDFNISSTGTTHTFNIPTASATNRGALSSADWTAFNGKVPSNRALTLSAGSDISITGGTQDLSADRTWTIGNTATLQTTTDKGAITSNNISIVRDSSGIRIQQATAGTVKNNYIRFSSYLNEREFATIGYREPFTADSTLNIINRVGGININGVLGGIKIDNNGDVSFNGIKLLAGSGSPESVVTAPVGSMYLNTSGGAGTTLYVKESGSGNTGWAAK